MSVFRNLLRLCRISKDSNDSDKYPIQQASYLGKVVDGMIALPYGFHANIPDDSLGIMLMILGQEDNRMILPISPAERPKNLAPGDVVMYSPITGEKMTFLAAGGIVVDGDVTYNDNVTINGNLTVLGSTTLGATVTSNGKDISDTHTHPAGTPPGNTGEVN